ncbi:MAG TPA: hypothetical protein VJU15_16680 [Gemmatimonadales bacterium]|nr:hypothetical protein [Gemmatimonadales bacterium]
MSHAPWSLPRRGFLASLTALLAAPHVIKAEPSDPDAWIDRLTGSHRAMIQTHQYFMSALVDARTMMANARDAYGIRDGDFSIAVIAHGVALQGLLSDETWQRFGLGEFYKVNDPKTGAPSVRNFYLGPQDGEPPDAAVRELTQRGVVFVACNVALKGLARKLARGGSPDAIYPDLKNGLVPGVALVPDVFVTITRAQERGLRYIYTDRPR